MVDGSFVAIRGWKAKHKIILATSSVLCAYKGSFISEKKHKQKQRKINLEINSYTIESTL